MRICRFDDDRLGVVQGDVIRDVTAALEVLPSLNWPIPHGDALVRNLGAVRARIAELVDLSPTVPVGRARLLSPVANPSKIIGAPVNYAAHEAEIDDQIRHGHQIKPISEWGLFLKAVSAIAGQSEGIARRFPTERTDHEVELAVIIGKQGNCISQKDALAHVAGYTIGLDVTMRGPQFQSFRKSMDSYALLGPWLVTADEFGDPGDRTISLSVNGKRRQHSRTRHLIYDVPALIEYASTFYTLYPGDVIMTGTPDGVGPIQPGDRIVAEIEGIGELVTMVSDAA